MQLVELAVMRVKDRRALRFAHAVQHDDQAFVPPGREISAGGVRKMMVHMMHALFRKSVQITFNQRQQGLSGEHPPIQFGGCGVDCIDLAIGRVVKAVRDLVNILQRKTGFRQTKADGPGWKSCAVLLAIETLLGGSGDGHPVDYQGRGGIMALRDPVLAFLQTWPMSPLEGHRVFKSADS